MSIHGTLLWRRVTLSGSHANKVKGVVIHKMFLEGGRNIKACWRSEERLHKEAETRVGNNEREYEEISCIRADRSGDIYLCTFKFLIMLNVFIIKNWICINETYIWPLWKSFIWNKPQIHCKNKESKFLTKIKMALWTSSPLPISLRDGPGSSRVGSSISWPPIMTPHLK